GRAGFTVADRRDQVPEPQPFDPFDQDLHEGARDAAAAGALLDIYRDLDAVAVGRPGAEGGGVGVARKGSVEFSRQPRQTQKPYAGETTRHFLQGRGLKFESGRAVQHFAPIEGLDGLEIGRRSVADKRGHRRLFRHLPSLDSARTSDILPFSGEGKALRFVLTAAVAACVAATAPTPAEAQKATSSPATVDLRVCNYSGRNATVAVSYVPVGEYRFLNRGWFGVSNGSCIDLVSTDNR